MPNYTEYENAKEKDKLLLLLDLVTIFQPITYNELLGIFKNLIGEGYYQIEFDLKLLTALNYIKKVGIYYVKSKNITKMFYIYEKNKRLMRIRSAVINTYHKNDKKRLDIYIQSIGKI